MRQFRFVAVIALAFAGCARQPVLFVDTNARSHIEMLAGSIGSRPLGTPANDRAREYIVEQLRLFGFSVRVQEADARRAELGRTARVSNIIGVLPGARGEAIGLMSHYDSVPDAPGAADDALGVAVSLEAARVLAARGGRQWSLMVLVTDGEEAGLMGAAALMTDREVTGRLRAYLNFEAIGSAGPAMLFEAGPGNRWIVGPWAASAPHPRGGSYAIEIYRRLPNDTDFSIVKRHEIPGLNFASIGDSYAYHTARDTTDRVSPRMIRDLGENAVGTADALDHVDITARTAPDGTYFDVAGRTGFSYWPRLAWALALLSIVAGVIGWVKVTTAALRMGGGARWLVTAVWSALGVVAAVTAMIAATSALRVSREVFHPWYARPDWLFAMLASIGAAVAWGIVRAGQWLPARFHSLRHPVMTWSLVLPLWIALTTAALWIAPAAAYLWVLPLLTSGILLAAVPPLNVTAVRLASVLTLAITGSLWASDVLLLLRFVVAVFGRLPVITPVYVYPAILTLAGLMLVPPFLASAASTRPLLRPSLMTIGLLLLVVVTTAFAYASPAYTDAQPLRRVVRALQEFNGQNATWEVGSDEPGLDLGPNAPGGWMPVGSAPRTTVPWGRLPWPFVFRTTGPALGPVPAAIAGFGLQPLSGGTQLSVTVVPKEPGLTLAFILPEAVIPARSSLPGAVRLGRWTAVYAAPPADGVTFEASFLKTTPEQLRDVRVGVIAHGFPGGTGWQRLPGWIPQERTVWSATATWVLPAATGSGIAPVPPLR